MTMYGPRGADLSTRFWNKVSVGQADQCWPWLGYRAPKADKKKWYGMFNIGEKKVVIAHRLAWGLANGGGLTHGYARVPEGQCVLHSCDNPACCNPNHLRLGTHTDNMRDMISKGRARYAAPKGESSVHAKLNEAQVYEIRSLAGVRTQSVLAAEYGVTQQTIHDIQSKRSWKHLQ